MVSCLEQNLELVSRKNKNLAEKIQNVSELKSKFHFVYNESGQVILVKDGYILNNAAEPINEAVNIFQNIPSNSELDTYVLIGFELGYLLSHFANGYKGFVIVWEPCIETLRLTMELIDYSNSLNKENVFVVSNSEEFNAALVTAFRRKGKIHVLANEQYASKNYELIENLKKQLDEIQNEPYTGGSLKLNIGAGFWALKGWRTLDCYRDADFYADLRELNRLEIEDNCIEKAFSSHCIEHIKDEHIENMLKEIYRCMQPGGIFRISCPDFDIAANQYKNNNIPWFNWLKQSHMGEMFLNTIVSYEYMAGGPQASEELVKEKFETLSKDEFIAWAKSLVDESRPYIAHRNAIYFEKLKEMLEKAGFKKIVKSSYQKSADKELRGDMFDRYPEISLFVECYK